VHRLLKIGLALLPLLLCIPAAAQHHVDRYRPDHMGHHRPAGFDVFIPISKYIAQGDADKLSFWFDDNLEIALLSEPSNASRAQARQIVKNFFENHTPRAFEINHTAARGSMKYALGTLRAGGESFSVTIFVRSKGRYYKIQQLKIERQIL